QLQLFLHARVDTLSADAFRERADQREQQDCRPDDGEYEKEYDFFGHRYLTGGSRSAARCFATNRSRKSTRSPSSLSCSPKWRSSSTSPRSCRTSSVVSSVASAAPFFPRMRAAHAFPTGEIESNMRDPTPTYRTTSDSE